MNLSLRKGLNEIKVYADELAERDVFFDFELRYKGVTPVEGSVEVTEQPEKIQKAEQILKSCYFEQSLAVRTHLVSIHKLRTAFRTLHCHRTYLPFRAAFDKQAAILSIYYTIKSLCIKTVYICLCIV